MATGERRGTMAPQETSKSQPLVTEENAQLHQIMEQMTRQGRILDKVLGLIDEIADKQTRAETRLAEVQEKLQTKMMEEMRSMEEHMSDHVLSMVTKQQRSVEELAEQFKVLERQLVGKLIGLERKMGEQRNLDAQQQLELESRLARMEEFLQQWLNAWTSKQRRLEELAANLRGLENQMSGKLLDLERKLDEPRNLQMQGVEALTTQQQGLETRMERIEESLQQAFGSWAFKSNRIYLASLLILIMVVISACSVNLLTSNKGVTQQQSGEQLKGLETQLTQQLQEVEKLLTRMGRMEGSLQQTLNSWASKMSQCPTSPDLEAELNGPLGSEFSDEPWSWSWTLWIVVSYLLTVCGALFAGFIIYTEIEKCIKSSRKYNW